MADAFTHNMVHFTRLLRAQGLRGTPETTVALIEAAEAVGLADRDDAYHAFRAVVIGRPDEVAVFDQAFELFFGSGRRWAPMEPLELKVHPHQRMHIIAPTSVAAGVGGEEEVELDEQLGASASTRLSLRDFTDLSTEEYAQVQRLIARMVWQPADTRSRRWRPSRSGSRPDLRRTLRLMTGPAGEMMPLAMSAPKPRRRPLLVLADVSGSMERYTEMLLYFIHAARGRLGKVEAFVFSTHLHRITRELAHRDPKVALSRVGDAVHDWSSGTLIGEALADFNRNWSRRVVRGGPVALVISDGWDRGDPDVLRVEMAAFARTVHRVVWLNPLAGRAGFAPETRGMRAAMPYVDDFLPVGTLSDLAAVVRLLETVPRRRSPRPRLEPAAPEPADNP
jgi:uncharacterized protein with von Willebrand factor type A (vWA) domain